MVVFNKLWPLFPFDCGNQVEKRLEEGLVEEYATRCFQTRISHKETCSLFCLFLFFFVYS